MPKPVVIFVHCPVWALRGAGCLAAMMIAFGTASTSVATPPEVGQAVAWSDRVAIAQPPKAISDFELVDQEGHPFKFSQLRNRPALVFFGFTHCPEVCPATL